MSLLGKSGIRRIAEINLARAHDAKRQLIGQSKLSAVFSGPFFNEFVLRGEDLPQHISRCAGEKIVPGVGLEQWYPELRDCLLTCVTEMNDREEIDRLVRTIAG
jgi:glycine dehydrogenase subunit 1